MRIAVSATVCLLLWARVVRVSATYDAQISQADAYLSRLAKERVLGGIVAVQKDGELVWSGGYGYAVEEFDVKLEPKHLMQVGSNTKLFTAIAIYQLAEMGYLNVSDPVNDYIDPQDFNLTGTWCPLIHGRENEGCQKPTFRHLLSMNSGGLASSNQRCSDGTPPWSPSDWYWPYRSIAISTPLEFALGWNDVLPDGTFSIADSLRLTNWLQLPFQNAPGERYCYANNNFVLAGYLVEKLSGMKRADFIKKHITEPLGMKDTYVWAGARGASPSGVRHNEVLAPGYVSTFGNVSEATGLPAHTVVKRSTDFNPSQLPLLFQATGDMISTVFDLLKLYNTLINEPELLGLTDESVAKITEPVSPVAVMDTNATNGYFAQGVASYTLKTDASLHSLTYTGNVWQFATSIRYYPNSTDPAKSDAVLFFSNFASGIAPQQNGTCAIATGDGPLILDERWCAPGGAPGHGSDAVLDQLEAIFDAGGQLAKLTDNSTLPFEDDLDIYDVTAPAPAPLRLPRLFAVPFTNDP